MTTINGRWRLDLPAHRAKREEWPWFEAARLSAIHHRVRELGEAVRSPVVYDIGSECGDFAALCASWGCQVVMAEPNPRAWPSARWAFAANRLGAPLATWEGFIGDKTTVEPGDEDSLEPWPECANGEIVGDFGQYALGEDGGLTFTLDDFVLAVHTPPDLVSIDVEGAELLVLAAGRETLTTYRPDVFVSIHPELAAARYGFGNYTETIRWLMCEYGYEHSRHTFLARDHEEHWWFRP
jgi:FkbM family methyltransferase